MVGMSLLEDLRQVTLSGDQVPAPAEVQSLLGSVIKALEAAGIKVAESLLPAPVDQALAPLAAGAAPVEATVADDAAKALADLFARSEALISKLEGKSAPAPAPASPAAVSGPVAPPLPGAN